MKRNVSIIILILIPWMTKAQLNEQFNDGEFITNPAWAGDQLHFKVNSNLQLQLNSSGENASYLATQVIPVDSMEWSLWVKLGFSPSDNNFAKIYLISDQQDLKGSLNGVYLKLGESGSDDAIELVHQTGNTHQSICRGTDGLIASSFSIRIKVFFSVNAGWFVFADPGGGMDYSLEASASGTGALSGSWFGVVCKYTGSNSTKFTFDDFKVGKTVTDQEPPQLLTVGILTSNSLKLLFNEAVNKDNAADTLNYFVDHLVGHPFLAQRDVTDPTKVYIAFREEFKSDCPYRLTVSGIKDLSGNEMEQTSVSFQWHNARTYDILIHEIMCDPDPPISLPVFEYIELFNRSAFPVDLTGWTLEIGSTVKSLPPITIDTGNYILLSDDAALPFLEPFGVVVAFTSLTLANAGNVLTLRNHEGRIIHSVNYSDNWYRNDFRKEGGWSLEMIDTGNPCGEAENWKASVDISGGTPGRENSVKATNPDLHRPGIERIGISDSYHVVVSFNESMDSVALCEPGNYLIDKEMGAPIAAGPVSPGYRQVKLELAKPIQKGIIYTLTVDGNFMDCTGNMLFKPGSARFALPELPDKSKLVINEVLFDPIEGCEDFIEIFNRSLQVFDVKDLMLSNYDTLTGELFNSSSVSSESYLIFPGDYLVFTTDTASVTRNYRCNTPGLLQVLDIPSMSNESGSIGIALKNGQIIDLFSYSDDMHFPLLINTEGVSLERISPDRSSGDRLNWHSASKLAGYATPGMQNSQFGIIPETHDVFSLSPEIFSPDNDGFNDNLFICYTFPEPGTVATVNIYDASGHLVRNLVNNELCGTSGSWTWDGVDNRRVKAMTGMYIILLETFDLKGKVKRYKKVAVLGGKL